MEIEGRECKEIKIGEHSYWFIEKFRGKEVRVIVQEATDDKLKMNQKILLEKMPELFLTLCRRIDENTLPTVAFLDSLDAQEYIKVQEVVLEEVGRLFTELQ